MVEAKAVSGHPYLQEAAEDAARRWKFTPTKVAGKPVKVIGTITFSFEL
ncbi:MAG TPA: TonB family protein [Blastocatellia bacterium]|nr:TonB family protein [Blastocatellia bacterium]